MSKINHWVSAITLNYRPFTPVISIPQVVAYNLKRGREARGISQQQLGELLGEATGRTWSTALLSAAESGWAGRTGRVRVFDVEDLVAFSLVLRLPLAWFLLPPATAPNDEVVGADEAWIQVNRQHPERLLTSELLRLLVLRHQDEGDPDDLLGTRLRAEALDVSPPPPDVGQQLHAELVELLAKYEHRR